MADVKQKTLTDLLGPGPQPSDEVAGRFIVRVLGADMYRVLWAFETDYAARAAFNFWRQESFAGKK